MVSTVDGAIVSFIVLSQKHIIEALAAIEVYITVLTHNYILRPARPPCVKVYRYNSMTCMHP